MGTQPYKAILLDLDGTLLNDSGQVSDSNREALRAADARGVHVILVTGRSVLGTLPVLEGLGLDSPAVVFNGAAVYCPSNERLIEERVLSNVACKRTLEYARRGDHQVVLMCSAAKFAGPLRDDVDSEAVSGLEGLRFVEARELDEIEYVIRATIYSRTHAESDQLAGEVEAAIERPVYLTHFPLSFLPHHRESQLRVVDVHPPCRGKAEALRLLWERYRVPAREVVAVGDASNDEPMLRAAGLGVAMQHSMASTLEVADRVIGSNDSEAIAELVEELFPVGIARGQMGCGRNAS